MKQGLTDQSKKFKFFLSVIRSHWTILRQRVISYIYIYILYIYIYTHTHVYISFIYIYTHIYIKLFCLLGKQGTW